MRLIVAERDSGLWVQLEGETAAEMERLERRAKVRALGLKVLQGGVNTARRRKRHR